MEQKIILHAENFLEAFCVSSNIVYRWNVKRKWKQAVDFQGLGRDEQLDEAYMDELEQQVYPKLFPILSE